MSRTARKVPVCDLHTAFYNYRSREEDSRRKSLSKQGGVGVVVLEKLGQQRTVDHSFEALHITKR